MTKLREQKWADRPRIEKLASAMYPNLIDEATRRDLLAANPEQRPGLQRRMDQGDRMYGKAQPSEPSNLDRVPGLKRVQPTAPSMAKPWWSK